MTANWLNQSDSKFCSPLPDQWRLPRFRHQAGKMNHGAVATAASLTWQGDCDRPVAAYVNVCLADGNFRSSTRLRTERERSNQSHRRQHDFMQGWIFHRRSVDSKQRFHVKIIFRRLQVAKTRSQPHPCLCHGLAQKRSPTATPNFKTRRVSRDQPFHRYSVMVYPPAGATCAG